MTRIYQTLGTVVVSGLLICLIIAIPSPREPRAGGTFIGAAVTDDGIVVASDSRTTFIDEKDKAMGYLDGIQKIYTGNGSAVAVSGLTSLNGELFKSFVDRNAFLLDRSATEVLFGFSAWLPFKNSTNVLLISAGFVEGKPQICARSVVQPQTCRDNGLMDNRPSPLLEAWMKTQRLPRMQEAAFEMEKAIADISTGDPTVGGPVNILQVKASGTTAWIKNSSEEHGWKTICDIVNDYRAHRINIVSRTTAQELTTYLNSSCPLRGSN